MGGFNAWKYRAERLATYVHYEKTGYVLELAHSSPTSYLTFTSREALRTPNASCET